MSLFPLRLLALVATTLVTQAQAASVVLTPAAADVPPSAVEFSFELVMDFASNEATLGGGIDLDLQGPISDVVFVPSAYFQTAGDPLLSGWSTLRADNDLEVHIGNFAGLSGRNVLGTVTVNTSLLNGAVAEVRLATNTYWGGFFSITGAPQSVTMTGAVLNPVPEPGSAMLLAMGTGALMWRLRRQRASAAQDGH
jgi:PEP-CTERM motif